MGYSKSRLLIGVLAMVLAIPLAMFANFMIPHLLNCYSTTSQERLIHRIAHLEKRLERAKNEWTFTPADWEMYRTIVISEVAALSFGCFVFAVIFGVINRRPVHSVWQFRFQLVLSLGGCMTFTVLAFRAMNHSDAMCTMHSERGRYKLQHELRRLKSLADR